MEKTFLIYMHTSPSGKSYIGQTCDLAKRNNHHKNGSSCRLFANAIKKYGWDNFVHKVLADGLTLEEANSVEAEMITFYKTRSPSGYNLKEGGLSSSHAEETKAKISIGRMGKKHSPETIAKIKASKAQISADTRLKISESAKNRIVSAITREKLSIARKGKPSPITEEGRQNISKAKKGIPRSEASKKKQSESRKGKPASNKGKPMSLEQREKLRKIKSVTSDETRARMSVANKAAWEIRKANGTANRSHESIQRMVETKAKKKAAQGGL